MSNLTTDARVQINRNGVALNGLTEDYTARITTRTTMQNALLPAGIPVRTHYENSIVGLKYMVCCANDHIILYNQGVAGVFANKATLDAHWDALVQEGTPSGLSAIATDKEDRIEAAHDALPFLFGEGTYIGFPSDIFSNIDTIHAKSNHLSDLYQAYEEAETEEEKEAAWEAYEEALDQYSDWWAAMLVAYCTDSETQNEMDIAYWNAISHYGFYQCEEAVVTYRQKEAVNHKLPELPLLGRSTHFDAVPAMDFSGCGSTGTSDFGWEKFLAVAEEYRIQYPNADMTDWGTEETGGGSGGIDKSFSAEGISIAFNFTLYYDNDILCQDSDNSRSHNVITFHAFPEWDVTLYMYYYEDPPFDKEYKYHDVSGYKKITIPHGHSVQLTIDATLWSDYTSVNAIRPRHFAWVSSASYMYAYFCRYLRIRFKTLFAIATKAS